MNREKMARRIENHYNSHSTALKLTEFEVIGGGERTIFNVKLKKGTKESLVFDRARDIQTALKLPLFQPFKEGLSIRLAVSERPVTENSLEKMLASPMFRRGDMYIPIALGYNMRGIMRFADVTKFPHALYGGATGSGKSVGLRSMIASIAAKQPISRVNLVIIDTGASDLDVFNLLPHLSYPIVKDIETAVEVMQALVDEMERRVSLPKSELLLLPAIVCIVDEYLSLIEGTEGIAKASLTSNLSSLLRKGRHAKIHIVLATQESAKQDMSISLNNINARIAFACSDFYSSRSILGQAGAEKLTTKGTMLFKHPECPDPEFLQGALMDTKELELLVSYVTSCQHDLSNKFVINESDLFQPTVMADDGTNLKATAFDSKKELVDIIMWALSCCNVSALQIQKRFKMGNRASKVVENLFQMNLITDKFANQPRAVLPQSIDDIPEDVMELLSANGVTEEDILDTIKRRG